MNIYDNSIYENKTVNQELIRMNGLIDTDSGRYVQADIHILKEALDQIDSQLLKGNSEYVLVDVNMWYECQDSLNTIMDELNLDINESMSNFENHIWAIVKIKS